MTIEFERLGESKRPGRWTSGSVGALAPLTVVGIWLCAATPAMAIEPEALRDKIAGTFDTINLGMTPEQGATYTYDAIEVEPQGDSFRVTIPGLKVMIDPTDQTRLLVGTAAFTMHPAGDLAGDDVYRISDAELPSTMGVVNGDGSPAAGVRLGEFSLDALWSFAYLTTLSLDLAMGGVELVEPNNNEVITLKSMTANVRTDQKAGDKHDVVLNLELDKFAGGDGDSGAEIGKVVVLSRLTDYDLAAAAAIYGEIKKTMNEQTSPEQQAANLMDMMFAQDFWRVDSETQIGLKNFRGFGTGEPDVSLESLDFGFSLEDANQPLSRTSFGFTQNGLKISGGDASLQSELAQGLIPEQSALQMDIERLPLKEIMTLAGTTANEAMLSEQAPEGQPGGEGGLEAMMLPMLFQLNQLMTQAGTTIAIRDSGVQTSLASLDMAGSFDVDPSGRLWRQGRTAGQHHRPGCAASDNPASHGKRRRDAARHGAQCHAGPGQPAGLRRPQR